MVENGYMEAVLGVGVQIGQQLEVYTGNILECGHLLKNTIER